MKLFRRQDGFSIFEIGLIVAVVVVVSAVGFMVYSRNSNNASQANLTGAATASDIPDAPEIKSTADLDKASSALDNASLDSSDDTSQLDAELNAF